MQIPILMPIYGLLLVIVSLSGGALPQLARMSHTWMQMLLSGVAGVMLGIGMLQMIPHAAVELNNDVFRVLELTLVGFLLMFFLQRISHFHHHELAEPFSGNDLPGHAGHHHDCDHDVAKGTQHSHPTRNRSISWLAAAAGLGVHGLFDGAALAASIQAQQDQLFPPAGLGTLLAILLHKPFDAMSIHLLLVRGNASLACRQAVNLAYACVTPLGVVLFEMFRWSHGSQFTGMALALAGGSFLCIAASDLLPELQFHRHDRWKLSGALLLGIGLAWLVGRMHGN